MGNTLGGKKTAKVMKINGETFKFKTPVKAGDVVKDYPGLVLLESEAVKHYGIRAKPLEAHQDLVPKRLYFLVELPETPTERVPRRVRSGINMSAKDRLESLMLSRRSTSDLSIMKPSSSIVSEEAKRGAMRVKMRLPKEEVEKLMQESKDEAEAAAKILDLCIANTAGGSHNSSREIAQNGQESGLSQQAHWKSGHGRVGNQQGIIKAREKRVSFLPFSEGEMQIAVASY
ncbi:hypothetical protein D5086_016548 [Populus alba]|uniref:Plastid movement impaired protein n=2 Tax=Populus alba TaxID=43335 RepID=A0A4U5NQB3_POPAL|nr:uncharacterized protein At1g66480-like [Populus alba]TKR84861.1 uncharacterized protein D5086_0000252140 [Populus alba]